MAFLALLQYGHTNLMHTTSANTHMHRKNVNASLKYFVNLVICEWMNKQAGRGMV